MCTLFFLSCKTESIQYIVPVVGHETSTHWSTKPPHKREQNGEKNHQRQKSKKCVYAFPSLTKRLFERHQIKSTHSSDTERDNNNNARLKKEFIFFRFFCSCCCSLVLFYHYLSCFVILAKRFNFFVVVKIRPHSSISGWVCLSFISSCFWLDCAILSSSFDKPVIFSSHMNFPPRYISNTCSNKNKVRKKNWTNKIVTTAKHQPNLLKLEWK